MKTAVKIILVTGIVGAGAVGAWIWYRKSKKTASASGSAAATGGQPDPGTTTTAVTGNLNGENPGIVPAATIVPSYTSPGGALNDFTDSLIGAQGPPPAPVLPEMLTTLSDSDLKLLDTFCMLPPVSFSAMTTQQSTSMFGSTDISTQRGRAQWLYMRNNLSSKGSLSDFIAQIKTYKNCS